MFTITHNLNKEANADVIFADEEFKFLNSLDVFGSEELKKISMFRSEFEKTNLLSIDLFRKNKKKKLIICKIKKNFTEYDFQKIGGSVCKELFNHESSNIIFNSFPDLGKCFSNFTTNFFIGLFSRNYNFADYKTKQDEDRIKIKKLSILSNSVKAIKESINYAECVYEGIKETRDLVTLPANILNPKKFVNEIIKLKKYGIEVEILNEKKLISLGMRALLGVGQGSSNESFLAIMKWNGNKSSKEKPLAFVGKGVCFDTGGISLKPANRMEEMKYDMGGAGTVTGLMKTLALRKAKVNVVGVVGLVENMADGNAQRPGDVVISYSGKSIEILNTDAEGRLVLADAIAYTEDRFKPKFIINLATLTGAIVVALGNEYAGLFSNNDKLANEIYESGLKENEKAWRFPLHDNYDRLMDSKIADLQNINYSGGAGSITAAQFLQRFIRKQTPWAHLDIAGMAWTKKDLETIPEGASGYGVKLLNRLIKEYYEK